MTVTEEQVKYMGWQAIVTIVVALGISYMFTLACGQFDTKVETISPLIFIAGVIFGRKFLL